MISSLSSPIRFAPRAPHALPRRRLHDLAATSCYLLESRSLVYTASELSASDTMKRPAPSGLRRMRTSKKGVRSVKLFRAVSLRGSPSSGGVSLL